MLLALLNLFAVAPEAQSNTLQATALVRDCTLKALSNQSELTIEDVWSNCDSAKKVETTKKDETIHLVATDQEQGFSRLASSWLERAYSDFSSFDAIFEADKEKLRAHPAGVLGGSMLNLPGYAHGLTSAIGLLAERVPDSAAPRLVTYVDNVCDDVDYARAFHETARKYPQLAALQRDVLDRLRQLPKWESHPDFARLSTRFLALSNTTGAKPYAALPVAPSFLGREGAARIIERNPGVLACDPKTLAATPAADIERAAGAVAWVDALPADVKAGIPFVTWLLIVGTIGARIVTCSGTACGSAADWDLQGGFGPQFVRLVNELLSPLTM